MNVYKIFTIGDLSAAGAAAFRNEYCQTIGQLELIADEFDDDIEGIAAATQQSTFRSESPIQYDLPASNAFVLYYQITTDTVCSEKITNLSKSTLVQGDVVVVLAPTTLPSEMSDYQTTPIRLTATAAQYLLRGVASDSQVQGVTPFATAIGKAYFSRANASATMAKVKAAKLLRLKAAEALVGGRR